jgi:hypothetical protein
LSADDISAWVSGFRAKPREAVWLVAADWFRERGCDAVADKLQTVCNSHDAEHVLVDTFWPLCRFHNVSAAHVNNLFRSITPHDAIRLFMPYNLDRWQEPNVSCIDSRKYTFPPELRVRELQFCRPVSLNKSFRFMEQEPWTPELTLRFRNNRHRVVIPSTRRTREFDITVTLWGDTSDIRKNYLLWPILPADVVVREQGRDVTAEVDTEFFDGMFDQTCPTDDEVRDTAFRRICGQLENQYPPMPIPDQIFARDR